MEQTPLRVARLALVGLLGLVAFFVARDMALYVGRSPSKAAVAAQQTFQDECLRRNLDARKYTGPILISESEKEYRFAFRGPSQVHDVFIIEYYLPRGTDVFFD